MRKEREVNKGLLVSRAQEYLQRLCGVEPNRRTGSQGNREAVEFAARVLLGAGWDIDTPTFPCLDYTARGVELTRGDEGFPVFISPYSPGCDAEGELVCIETVRELEECRCRNNLLLLKGAIASEQLMPKKFPFYNPEAHRRIYELLESKRPAAVITATGKNPETVGALDPFPMITDGDFDIPSVYCSEEAGAGIAVHAGNTLSLQIDAERIPAEAANVIARINPSVKERIVLTAHIDAYEDSPGAADNASGVVTLMILAEILAGEAEPRSSSAAHSLSRGYRPAGIEIVLLNGEDHYSAAGELDYLAGYGEKLDEIRVLVNLDDVGYREGGTHYSFYECPEAIRRRAGETFGGQPGFSEGPPWYQGDHMVFVQKGVPAIAFASEKMEEFMAEYAHTLLDAPDLVDCGKLVDLATGLAEFTRVLRG